jgi:SPP1 family predicted phage head-tail adaptor
MRAGELRHRVTIQRKVVTLNAFNEEIITWADVATVWASIETAPGGEFADLNAAGAALSHQITIRYLANLAPTMQVVYGDRAFNIEVVQEDNRNRQTVLLCSELVNA